MTGMMGGQMFRKWRGSDQEYLPTSFKIVIIICEKSSCLVGLLLLPVIVKEVLATL